MVFVPSPLAPYPLGCFQEGICAKDTSELKFSLFHVHARMPLGIQAAQVTP